MSNRASGGTLAAFLIIAAIVGFAGGAYLGTQSGDGAQAAPRGDSDTTSPGNQTGTDGEQGAPEPTEGGQETTPEDGSVSVSSPQDGGSVSGGNRIEYEGSINPPAGGVVLTFERRLDGGSWETFSNADGEPITAPETSDDGTFSGYVISGREGENQFRLVGEGPDGVSYQSEPITVTIE